MKIKKFNEINEQNNNIRCWKFEVDKKIYYGVLKSDGEIDIFDGYGNSLSHNNFPNNELQDDRIFQNIKYEDLPKEVVNAIKNKQKELFNQSVNNLDKQEEKSYADMNQKELNDLLNLSLDSGDFATSHKISQFMGESKIFRFNGNKMK